MRTQGAFVAGPCSLRVQSILFRNGPHHVDRALASCARAVEIAIRSGGLTSAEIALGDCSPTPVFDDRMIAERAQRLRKLGVSRLDYQFFDKNLGSAAGHNRLLQAATTDLVLIQNPDVVAAPNLFVELLEPLRRPGVAQVEARQIPIEHPKDYDAVTGETGWAATACSLIPRSVLEELRGFDQDTFFLYCDDVDFSWRVRLAGYKVVFQASACVYHDKRLSRAGKWIVGAAEEYYSAEAALLLAHKYSRPDLIKDILAGLMADGSESQRRAAGEFRKRQAEKRLPAPLDPRHQVAEFLDGYLYTRHRF
jgi:GT2 family glycosyltransferase